VIWSGSERVDIARSNARRQSAVLPTVTVNIVRQILLVVVQRRCQQILTCVFLYTVQEKATVYLLATSGGGRRCKANFILSLPYKRKRTFHQARLHLRFLHRCSLYTYNAADDVQTIGSCCSVVCLYWYCAFDCSYILFCCVLLSLLCLPSRSFTNTVTDVVFVYCLFRSFPSCSVSTVQHAVKQYCHLPGADATIQ
jgi:hypothetical protein